MVGAELAYPDPGAHVEPGGALAVIGRPATRTHARSDGQKDALAVVQAVATRLHARSHRERNGFAVIHAWLARFHAGAHPQPRRALAVIVAVAAGLDPSARGEPHLGFAVIHLRATRPHAR